MVVARRKYNCGRLLKTVLLFGGIERVAKKFFIVPLITDEEEGATPDVVPRTAEVLVGHIKKYNLPGSVVYSDMWKGYDSLGKNGYTHHLANHFKEFVSSIDPTIHTQNIERLWRDVKECIKKPGMVLHHLHKYIARFIFCRTITDVVFLKFLLAAAELHLPNSNKTRAQPLPIASDSEDEENDQ